MFIRELGKCISKYDLKQNLLLIGDTNIDLKTISTYRDTYLETLSERGLMCGITDYTRIAKKGNITTKSCIDHIFARFPTFDPYSAALDIVLADHRAVIITCVGEASSDHIQRVQKYIIKPDILYQELKKINWSQATDMNSPDEISSFIHNSFQTAYKTATCSKTYTNKQRSAHFRTPWIDDNVTRLCEKRNKLFYTWKKSANDPKLHLEYNQIRNKVHKIIEYKKTHIS